MVYTYNPDGSQHTATRNTYTTGNTPATTFVTTNIYDAYGRLQSVSNMSGTASAGTLQYTYDAVGNKLSIVDPDKSLTTTYAYDADDRLQQVTHPGGAVTAYTYDKVGNRQSLVRPNHITTTYTYDTLNRLTDLKNVNTATSAVVSSYHYQLALDGKRLSVTDQTNATTSYGYDADDRLVSEATPTSTTSYVYDSVGNRLSKTAGGTTTTSAYDVDDRNTAYTYNLNGDVLSDGTHSYSYDFEDHLTASGTGGTQTASYTYDADGNRIQKVDGTGTTNYLVDTNRTYAEVLEERDASGTVLARYDYGDDLIRMDRGTSTRYYLFDGLGSTRQLTDGTGAVTDTYAYDAFGNLTAQAGSTVNPYLFNGQEQDGGTGLYYLRARYMNPQDGRFLSQDPFGGDNEDPISLHRYLYVAANPVNEVDPGGEDLGGIAETLSGIAGEIALNAIPNVALIFSSSLVGAAAGGYLFARTGGSPIGGALVGVELGSSLALAGITGRGGNALVSAVIDAASSVIVDGFVALFTHVNDESIDEQIKFIDGVYQSMFEAAASGAASVAIGSFVHQSLKLKAQIATVQIIGQDIIDDYDSFEADKSKVIQFGVDLVQILLDGGTTYGVTILSDKYIDPAIENKIKAALHHPNLKILKKMEKEVEICVEGVGGIAAGVAVNSLVEELRRAVLGNH